MSWIEEKASTSTICVWIWGTKGAKISTERGSKGHRIDWHGQTMQK